MKPEEALVPALVGIVAYAHAWIDVQRGVTYDVMGNLKLATWFLVAGFAGTLVLVRVR